MDISGHQTSAEIDAALVGDEVKFVIIKATEGKSFVSDAFGPYRAKAHADGCITGAYHFGWFNQDPTIEARFFLTTVKPRVGEVVVVDAEDWGVTDPSNPKYAAHKAMRDATPWSQRVAYLITWLRVVGEATGCKPAVYANWNWIQNLRTAATIGQWVELSQYGFWVASLGLPGVVDKINPKTGTTVAPKVVMHQYTWDRNGSAPGQMDGNWVADLSALKSFTVTKAA